MDTNLFMPFNEVFKHYNEQEQEHIRWLLAGYQTFIDSDNGAGNTRKAAAALRWVLILLKELEPAEE